MKNKIKELIEKWYHEFQECETISISPRVMLEFTDDLEFLLELYKSQQKVAPESIGMAIPTIYKDIYQIGEK